MAFSAIPRTVAKRALVSSNLTIPSSMEVARFLHTTPILQKAAAKESSIRPGTPRQQEAMTFTSGSSFEFEGHSRPPIPRYLADTYTWAYLSESSVPFLDNNLVVSGILWGNANRLMKSAVNEFTPGQRVLQPACVYGNFSKMLAEQLGPEGHLFVSDVATVQLEQLQPKVAHMNTVTLALADAREPVGGPFDAVCCFFLLHEVPDDVKADIVKSLFKVLQPGGKIVFVDYHKPVALHPLKGIMSIVFDTLEPFAKGLWDKEIKEFCPEPENYEWSKETVFGGLYQKVIAQCKKDSA